LPAFPLPPVLRLRPTEDPFHADPDRQSKREPSTS
jgi:hypothetical protein